MLCVAHIGLPLRIMLTGPLIPLSGEALLSDLAQAMGDVSTLMRNAGSTGPDDALLARNLSIKRGTAPDLASASAPAFTVQVTINSKLLLHHEAAQTRYQHTLLLWEALSFKEPPLYSLSTRLQTSVAIRGQDACACSSIIFLLMHFTDLCWSAGAGVWAVLRVGQVLLTPM